MSIEHYEIINDIKFAKEVLLKNDFSVVVIKYGKILAQRKNNAVISILELIDEMGENIFNSVIGINNLGKASALLCNYINSSGVYSPSGTKNGVDILIELDIPYQVDEIITKISNDFINKSYMFEEMVNNIKSSKQAYKILKRHSPIKNPIIKQAVIDPITGKDTTGDFVSDYQKDIQDSLDKIFLQAKISKKNNRLSKQTYHEIKNNMELIIKKYYNVMKLPVDEKFLNKNKKKLENIFDNKND